ncbi:MAG: hypothetical protein NTU54_04665 [Candidatus Omnitrophica bacterium]|nr:hypothetical protein [Candidatus Omnitrophota bacterium]
MTQQILKSKLLAVVVLLLAFTVPCSSNAFAWGGHGGHGHYYYRGGRWHDTGWFWGSFATGIAIGTIVATLPPYHETVYVSGAPYYYYDSIYYRPCPSGYIVVPAPATTTVVTVPAAATVVTAPAVTQPKEILGETVVINVPNSGGGYTPVTLIKYKTGYIGPQGEYYEGHPTVKQLRVFYGN